MTGDVRKPQEPASFAETALQLGGKSREEATRTGAVDRADDQVEALFLPQYQTTASPAHRAVWERAFPVSLFQSEDAAPSPDVQRVMERSVEIVRRHVQARTLLNDENRVAESVLAELGEAGYWGLLVDPRYGGTGCPFRLFAPFLTRMATIDATVAGLASVHGCIGAVDPVRTFGTPEQKARFLPELASGQKLSAFALTEPGAGSDLTALRTRAVRDGDVFRVTGEKLFITNVLPGRRIGLVCLIDDDPAVLIADLPPEENDQFQLVRYGLYALKHTYNRGIRFKDFPVPADNLLTPPRGNGLTIAYHGLNLGRVSLCANAAGTMRVMLASMLPWARFRKTYGQPIIRRELVRRRIGRLAGLIVASDALVAWCSGLIDQGFRGEMECIVAKIFGAESQIEAAVQLCMKTHGGRSFLHGHLVGDNIHEFLAPSIYEGEGEMLAMGFFKSLVKQHGTTFFEPIGRALAELGVKKPHLANPRHFWKLKGPLWAYTKWLMAQKLLPRDEGELPKMPPRLRDHAAFAIASLQRVGLEISAAMRKYQLKLVDRQMRMSELSLRTQKMLVIVCTPLYAARHDEVVQLAADVVCGDLRRELEGRRPTDADFRRTNELGEAVAEDRFSSIAGVEAAEILMPYDNG